MRFSEIREYEGDQKKGFEELICQIARRSPPSGAKEFRRVEGSGGDGGVEAYWTTDGGKKIGYQAKSFLATKDINWSQIDESVKQALDTHPELKEYIVAFACDLTDRSGDKGRGKRGWGHWESHKEKWNQWASKRSITVTFSHWTKSDIADQLAQPEFVGLAASWFDTLRFTQDWFKEYFELPKADLDQRYHPEDHVPVSVSRLFNGMTRNELFCFQISRSFEEATEINDLQRYLSRLSRLPAAGILHDLIGKLDILRSLKGEIPNLPSAEMPVVSWKKHIQSAEALSNQLSDWLWEGEREKENPSEHNQTNYYLSVARRLISNLIHSLRHLDTRLDDIDVKGDQKRAAIVVGESGTGKSHMVADAVSTAVSDGRPALLLLGQYFSNKDPWETVRSKLDIIKYSADELLQALDAVAEAQRVRCLIVIDALNETSELNVWTAHLASFITKLLSYENLALVLTCRPEYEAILLPTTIRDTLVRVECRGFETTEEQESAARQYLEKRGIIRPSTPWLAPEFNNPLFLQTCSNALQTLGRTEFPRGLRGITGIFEFYIQSLQVSLARKYPHVTLPVNCVRNGLLKIAKRMADNRQNYVSRPDATQLLTSAFETNGPSTGKLWLDVLVSEGALRQDHNISENDAPFFADIEDVYRFAYQRYSDHLVVKVLLDSVEDISRIFEEDEPFSFIIEGSGLNWKMSGLLPALSVQIPERFEGIELADLLTKKVGEYWTVQNAFGRVSSGEATMRLARERVTFLMISLRDIGIPAKEYS